MGLEDGTPDGVDPSEAGVFSEATSKFELITNPKLDAVLEFLETKPIDFDQIIQEVIETEAQTRQIIKPRRAVGLLTELYTREMLKRFADSNSGLELDPIPDGHETESYLFKKSGGNLIVRDRERIRRKEHEIDIAEIDAVVLADDLPSVFEVKTGVYKGDQHGVKSAVRPDFIDKILSPLTEHFNSNRFGYVAVGLSEVQGMLIIRERLAQLGGVLVALPIPLAEMTIHADDLARRNQQFRDLRRKQI